MRRFLSICIVISICSICTACGKEKDEPKMMASALKIEYINDDWNNGMEVLHAQISENEDALKEQPDDLAEDYTEFLKKLENQRTASFSAEEYGKIVQYLGEQVPEIDNEWADYVKDKSEGKACIDARVDNFSTFDIYRDYENTEYLGKYYLVYVGEQWEDHSALWAYFYVSEDFDEVLWYDIVAGKDSEYPVLYLNEWRNSDYYPKLDK